MKKHPSDFRLHPLLQKLPPPDVASPEWDAFVDNMSAAGPDGIDPLIVAGNLVMSGGRRWRAAKQLQWPEIAYVEQPEEFAAAIIVESLFTQRNITRGGKVYLALGLLPEYTKAAEARRLANLNQGRRTLDKPLKTPNPSNLDSATLEQLAARWGVSDETILQAKKVRELFAKDKSIKEEYEPQLLDGRKNLWNVISGSAGAEATAGKQKPVNSSNQLELFTTSLEPLTAALAPWNRIKLDEREAMLAGWRKMAVKLPSPCRKELAQILLSVEDGQ